MVYFDLVNDYDTAIAMKFNSSELPLVAWADTVATRILSEELPRRWQHVQGSRRLAEALAPIVGEDADLVVAAVLCHQMGHASVLRRVGYHPLDVAYFLRAMEAPSDLVNMCAHSIDAKTEGEIRGLAAEYTEFPDEPSAARDALWYCCLTTGPDGDRVRFEDRLNEARIRYADNPIVLEWAGDAAGALSSAIQRTRARIAQAGLDDLLDQ